MKDENRNSTEDEDSSLTNTVTHVVVEPEEGQTGLDEAAKAGALIEVQKLLENGAAITTKDDNGWTALHWAAFHGHDDMVLLLLEKWQGIDVKNSARRTSLH